MHPYTYYKQLLFTARISAHQYTSISTLTFNHSVSVIHAPRNDNDLYQLSNDYKVPHIYDNYCLMISLEGRLNIAENI